MKGIYKNPVNIMSKSIKSSKEFSLSNKYLLEYEEELADCKGYGLVLRHRKSGARICVISNDDENKVFTIMFRTPPKDSTGVAHIIEHSVLAGSRKFPTKDPFMDLAKGSLNTFLNAFTYPDKTCYPVASCNEKDFANLMDVYMDAVLHPNIYTRPEIFKQEGWHYELNSKEEPITVNGIVYSEMKGVFSSPDDRFSQGTFNSLFPDTIYSVVSGGDPKNIPELTYEEYLEFHKTYYHPSNSFIYLYGDMDIEERLEWLDEAYLKDYDVISVDSEIGLQKPEGLKEFVDYYPITEDDNTEEATFLTWAGIIGKYDEVEKILAFDAIGSCLFNIPGAPLREALVRAGIGMDVSCAVEKDVIQPFIQISIRNSEADRLPEFKRILREELQKIVENGFDRDSMLGILNRMEFEYAEADTGYCPKGLIYILNSASTWLYDERAAFLTMNRCGLYSIFRDKLDKGYFEDLVKRYMLDNDSAVFFTLEPKLGFGQDDKIRLEERLKAMKEAMSSSEIEALIEENRRLKEYQSTPSAKEDLAKIPILAREDLDVEPMGFNCEKMLLSGVPVSFHDYETNGIVYLRILFDMDRLSADKIQQAELLCKFLGAVDTKVHTYSEFNSLMNIHTGGISAEICSFNRNHDDSYYRPMLVISTKFMVPEAANALSLVREFIYDADLTSVKRAHELMGETKARMQAYFMDSGHIVSMQRARAGINSESVFKEKLDGISYYNFVTDTNELPDEKLSDFLADTALIIKSIFGRDNCIVSLTCNNEIKNRISGELGAFLGGLECCGALESDHKGWSLEVLKGNEAYKYSGDVNFVSYAGKCALKSVRDGGILNLVRNILNSEYLYEKLRVLGGAYGGGFACNPRTGNACFYSYRDPNVASTLEAYKNTAEFIRNYSKDDREILKLIIGTIGALDSPLSPCAKGARAFSFDMEGITLDEVRERRAALINATVEDIRSLAYVFEEINENCVVSAVASETSIASEGQIFDSVERMF